MRFAALFDPMVRAVVGELGSVRNMDASHAKAVLGWAHAPAEESIVDTARSLIDLGIVKVRAALRRSGAPGRAAPAATRRAQGRTSRCARPACRDQAGGR